MLKSSPRVTRTLFIAYTIEMQALHPRLRPAPQASCRRIASGDLCQMNRRRLCRYPSRQRHMHRSARSGQDRTRGQAIGKCGKCRSLRAAFCTTAHDRRAPLCGPPYNWNANWKKNGRRLSLLAKPVVTRTPWLLTSKAGDNWTESPPFLYLSRTSLPAFGAKIAVLQREVAAVS